MTDIPERTTWIAHQGEDYTVVVAPGEMTTDASIQISTGDRERDADLAEMLEHHLNLFPPFIADGKEVDILSELMSAFEVGFGDCPMLDEEKVWLYDQGEDITPQRSFNRIVRSISLAPMVGGKPVSAAEREFRVIVERAWEKGEAVTISRAIADRLDILAKLGLIALAAHMDLIQSGPFTQILRDAYKGFEEAEQALLDAIRHEEAPL